MNVFSREKMNNDTTESGVATKERKSKRVVGALDARRTEEKISFSRLKSKGAFTVAAGLILLMAIAFMASAMLSRAGAFTIRAQQAYELGKEAGLISLSETQGFANPTINLSAKAVDGMDNITYEWLPMKILDSRDGCYNGDNYIAYTFYMKNAGSGLLNYEATLNILDCTHNIDDAVRVMIYVNGKPTIYAKRSSSGRTESFPKGTVDFYSDDMVVDYTGTLAPDDINRYTVVAWLEGEDPECVDSVRGGTMRMEMVFTNLAGSKKTGTS